VRAAAVRRLTLTLTHNQSLNPALCKLLNFLRAIMFTNRRKSIQSSPHFITGFGFWPSSP
jgi:hypothetical protein